MLQQITEGVCITVETFYNKELSNPAMNDYIYAYQITIDNFSNFPFQLKSRFWQITDAFSQVRTVEGEGVVGKQPFLDPGQSFQYTSGVGLKTDMGKMEGYYIIENLKSKQDMQISIPAFVLNPPFKLN